MLPCVVARVVELAASILVLQVQLVAGFECNVGTICHFMGFTVDLFVQVRIREVLLLSDVLRDVADETEIFNVVLDEVIVLSTVVSPDGAEPFDHYIIVKVRFDFHWLAPVGEQVFFDVQSVAFCFQLVQAISKLREEHLLAVLFKKLEVTVCTAQQHRPVDLE